MKRIFLISAMLLFAILISCTYQPESTDKDTSANPVSDFQYTENQDGSITISDYVGTSQNVVIPAQIHGKKVTEIDIWVFRYNDTLVSIELPDSITSIYDSTFANCYNLRSVVLP